MRPPKTVGLFTVVTLCLAVSGTYASCPELDSEGMVKAVERAYNDSDLVFLGRAQESASFVGHAPEILVEAKWKGPEVLSIKMHWRPWRTRDSRVFFAARSDEDLGWKDSYPTCFPRSSERNIEQILTEELGQPIPPDGDAVSRTHVVFLTVMLAAVAGIAVFAWSFLVRPRA